MIYLFEDRKDRMTEFFDVTKYSGQLMSDKVISGNHDDFFNSLIQPKLILLHKSYAFTDGFTLDIIKNWCKQNRVKLVVFSGGLNNGVINDDFAMMNSGDFYKNLPSFLNFFSEHNRLNLPLLVLGKNYLLSEVKQFQNEFSRLALNQNYQFDEDDFDGLLTAQELEDDRKLLFDFMKKDNSHDVVKSQIQKFVNKYGNN